MSRPLSVQPVKLIASLLTSEHDLVDQVCARLTQVWGPLDFVSEALPFDFTDYYTREFGDGLFRRLISFSGLIEPDRLPAVKLFANDIEDGLLRENGARRINIDPGYVSLCHLILATCKPFTHRPYLHDGVYADMTLVFRKHSFRRLEWSFPDYSSEAMIGMLNKIREVYYQQLQEQGELTSG
ncbi:MAG: DUF4416 family protein [Deltaproteobacteria bacterium]|nr:DUF4416 family protein [Deltaproteobacteria bacterium]